jgi:hypothetical protein
LPEDVLGRLLPYNLQKIKISVNSGSVETAYQTEWNAISRLLYEKCPHIRASEVIVRVRLEKETQDHLRRMEKDGKVFWDKMEKNGQVFMEELSEGPRMEHCSAYLSLHQHLSDILVGYLPAGKCSVRLALSPALITRRGMRCGNLRRSRRPASPTSSLKALRP